MNDNRNSISSIRSFGGTGPGGQGGSGRGNTPHGSSQSSRALLHLKSQGINKAGSSGGAGSNNSYPLRSDDTVHSEILKALNIRECDPFDAYVVDEFFQVLDTRASGEISQRREEYDCEDKFGLSYKMAKIAPVKIKPSSNGLTTPTSSSSPSPSPAQVNQKLSIQSGNSNQTKSSISRTNVPIKNRNGHKGVVPSHQVKLPSKPSKAKALEAVGASEPTATRIGVPSISSARGLVDELDTMQIGDVKRDTERLVREFGAMAVSKHENLVYFKETLLFENAYFPVYEAIPTSNTLQTINAVIHNGTTSITANGHAFYAWTEPHLAHVLHSVVSALSYLHQRNRIFRNITTQSILVDSAGTVKLADFSLSCELTAQQPRRTALVGAPLYLAPEIVHNKPYDTAVDIWALGVLAIELAEGVPPLLRHIYNLASPNEDHNDQNSWSEINLSSLSPLKVLLLLSNLSSNNSVFGVYKLAIPSRYSSGFVGFVNSCFGSPLLKRGTAVGLESDIFIKRRCLQTAFADFLSQLPIYNSDERALIDQHKQV